MIRKYLLIFVSFLFIGTIVLSAQRLERVDPEDVGMDLGRLNNIKLIVDKSIDNEIIPGAVVAVVKDGKMAYLEAFGNKSVYPEVELMNIDVVFDLASVSKSVGTAISFMQLVEQGKVRLVDDVALYLPGFKGYFDPETGKETIIRIQDILTHSSGLPPYASPELIKEKYGEATPENLLDYIKICKKDFMPKSDFQYSCLNFVTLQYILEKITGQQISEYAQENVFDVLALKNTTYNPTGKILSKVAPTEKLKDGSFLLGEVHDPLARIINKGNSGNAGIFSDANDIAIIATALLNGGEYNGKRILSPLTVKTMTRVPSNVEELGRSLGWDNYSPYASNKGDLLDPVHAYGHTGYTGTSLVIDPINNVAVIILTHRVHPADKGSVVRLRANIANIVASSIEN